MNKDTRERIVLLKEQARTLIWMQETTGMQWYYREAEKCLDNAKKIYREYLEDMTDLIEIDREAA